jgi:hypothetical protein
MQMNLTNSYLCVKIFISEIYISTLRHIYGDHASVTGSRRPVPLRLTKGNAWPAAPDKPRTTTLDSAHRCGNRRQQREPRPYRTQIPSSGASQTARLTTTLPRQIGGSRG